MISTNRHNCNYPRQYKARSQEEEFLESLRLIIMVHIVSLDIGTNFFAVSIYIRSTNYLHSSHPTTDSTYSLLSSAFPYAEVYPHLRNKPSCQEIFPAPSLIRTGIQF